MNCSKFASLAGPSMLKISRGLLDHEIHVLPDQFMLTPHMCKPQRCLSLVETPMLHRLLQEKVCLSINLYFFVESNQTLQSRSWIRIAT